MPTHTIMLSGRNPNTLILTVEEAFELSEKGFRFSVFRPGTSEFRLSFPLETSHMPSDGTLTFKQADAKRA